jgi:hypothetical protein
MWQAIQKGLLSPDLTVTCGGVPVATIARSATWERGELRVGQTTFAVRSEGLLCKRFALHDGERDLAVARMASSLSHIFEIVLGADRVMYVKPAFRWPSRFRLFEAGDCIGEVRPADLFRRNAIIELPESLPVPARLFVFWLVLTLVHQDEAAAVVAATVAVNAS